MNSNSAVSLRDVNLDLNGKSVCKDISFDVAHGEFVAIVGPSGCGKTMLLNIISGHRKASAGVVECRGSIRRIYQHNGLLPWLSVRKNIELGVRRVRDAQARSKEVAAILDLIEMKEYEGFYPHQLSGGMRQRVELARAMCGHGDILLMDEPFSAIDYLSRLKLRAEFVRLLSQRPRTVVLVTHEIDEAVQLADRIIVLNQKPGRIVSTLTVDIQKPRLPASTNIAEMTSRVLQAMELNA